MTVEQTVVAYTESLIACVGAIRRQFGEATRLAPDEPLQLLPRDGGVGVREGHLQGLGEFQLHGVGCLIELSTGEIVDFDWDAKGREVFDGWRLRRFARSRGEDRYDEADLANAARSINGLIETKPGWFTLVNEFGAYRPMEGRESTDQRSARPRPRAAWEH